MRYLLILVTLSGCGRDDSIENSTAEGGCKITCAICIDLMNVCPDNWNLGKVQKQIDIKE